MVSFIVEKVGARRLAGETFIPVNYAIDLEFCKQIRMVRDFDGNQHNFHLLLFGEPSILLPNPSRTDTSNVANWIYGDVEQ